ncbi:hypothetical protein BH09GEM1_BH09GEM1_30070 [soil metagenome]
MEGLGKAFFIYSSSPRKRDPFRAYFNMDSRFRENDGFWRDTGYVANPANASPATRYTVHSFMGLARSDS